MAGILEETDGMQLPIRQLETLEYSAAVFSKGIHQVLEHSNSDISLSFNKRHLVKELSQTSLQVKFLKRKCYILQTNKSKTISYITGSKTIHRGFQCVPGSLLILLNGFTSTMGTTGLTILRMEPIIKTSTAMTQICSPFQILVYAAIAQELIEEQFQDLFIKQFEEV